MEPNLKYNVDSDNFYKYNELQGIQPLSSYVNNNDFFRQSKICFPIINYKFDNNSNLINFGTYGDYYNIKNLSNIDLLDIEPLETITLIFTDGNTSKYLISGYDRLNYLNSESVDITLKYGDTLHIINNSSEPISIKAIIDGTFSEVVRQQSGENFLKWTPSYSNVQYMYESITNSSNWGNIKFNSNSNNILLKNNNNLILNREFDIINNLTFSIWLKIDINILNDYFNAITNKKLNFFTINNNLIELNIRERHKTFQFNLKNQDNVNLIFENTIDRESIINDNNTDIILYEGDSLVIHSDNSEFNDTKDSFQIKNESEQIVNNINNTGSFGIPSIGRSVTWNLPIGNYKYYKNTGSEIVINRVFQDLTLNNWYKTADHQMVKFNNNTMIIFGGWGANSDLVDQDIFHVITINNDEIQKKTSQKITELSTNTSNYYKTIIIDNSLYIHVNVSNTVPDRIFKITFNGDPHDFDYTVKTYLIDSNDIPRRYYHGFFNIDNDFYLFSGRHDMPSGTFNNWLLNDLYRINLNDDETYTYSKLELDDTSDYITPRYLFGISKINNNIYILGGYASKNSDDPEPEEGYKNDRKSNEIFKLTINNNTYHSTLIRYNGYKEDLQMQYPHYLTLNNDIFIIGHSKDDNTLNHNYYNYISNKIYKLSINPDTDELTVKVLMDNIHESIGYQVYYATYVNINNINYGYLQPQISDGSYLDKRFIKI